MNRKRYILIVILINIFLLTACYSYHDIDEAIYVTALIVDIDDNNEILIYIECFKPMGGDSSNSQSGTRLIFKGAGKTIFEAVRTATLSSSLRINWTQNRVIMFTQRAAEYGLDNFVDFLDRDQELLIRAYVCTTNEDPVKLMETEYEENKYMGIFIIQMIEKVGSSSRAVKLSLNEYMKERLIGDKTSVIPIINLKKGDIGAEKINIVGGAIIHKDKMIGSIERQEGQAYSFLMNNVKSGTLEPLNPQAEGKYVTLEILNSKTKTKIEYKEEKIIFKKIINVETALGEIQGELEINDANLNKIKENTEENIRKACVGFFQVYKDENIDIFDVREVFNRKYPHEQVEDIMKITELELEVNVSINFYNEIKDFKKS
ncbi:Ger(x)C family spore germination protein [Clostridium grantii]|uniref:Germination protein, Ger(X)C family n=1 Tax=Clostridium grantii DSM 8605 TaxID=1121316 RepID=A0A1M5QNJ8_9CLOT|nr:Ger(x)C family spore germination protein [Clostridium grantii]SHH15451.1 germination protein, Ger(x)C family [Clostridium grantii DSM 8605]